MEDNNAINQQLDVVNEGSYNELKEAYENLKHDAVKLYDRVKQLENTWMLSRANFLFEILKTDAFSSDTKIRAEEELVNFLFPEPNQEENN